MGLPGSGKTTLSDKLSPLIDAERINADFVRKKFNDWDFSYQGRVRQSLRMKKLANEIIKKNKNVLVDFVCPTKETRKNFSADYVIWMNTISKGRFDDTNQMFESPNTEEVDFEVEEKNSDKYKILIYEDIKKVFKS